MSSSIREGDSALFKKLDGERRAKEELMIKIQHEERTLKVIL